MTETKNLIIAPIRGLGEFPNPNNSITTLSNQIWVLDKNSKAYPRLMDCRIFTMNICHMPYCCGTREIGSFGYYGGITNEELQNEIKEILSIELPIRLQLLIRERGTTYPGSLSFISMLINDTSSKIVRSVFESTKTFRMVNIFTNINTSRNIEMWVSRYGGITPKQEKLEINET